MPGMIESDYTKEMYKKIEILFVGNKILKSEMKKGEEPFD